MVISRLHWGWRVVAVLALLCGHSAMQAQSPNGKAAPAVPTGPVVLTVSDTSAANGVHKVTFDMKMLESLPQKTFTTRTPWYPNPITFTGPLLRDVLNAAGAKGSKLTAVALNDYKTEIPYADALTYDVIVARLMNERPMPVREKGPLFIVYPFDTQPALKAEIYTQRSAWQLSAIQVK